MREVESFKLDHTTFVAPYVTLAEKKQGHRGDVVTKYEIRLVQLHNKDLISANALNTLVDFSTKQIRDFLGENIIEITPMGCGTGFILIISGEKKLDEIEKIIIEILEQGTHRSLGGANGYVKKVLEQYKGRKI